MAIELADADLGNGLAAVAAGLDEVLAAGMDPADSAEAIDLIEKLETLGRRVDAARVGLVDVIDRKASVSGRWASFGQDHGPPRGQALRRRSRRPSQDGPSIAGPARDPGRVRGRGSRDRVRSAGWPGPMPTRGSADRLPEFEGPLLRIATAESYKVFDEVVGDWVRLADEDGTCDRNQRHHENRDFRPSRDFDGGWTYEGGCGSLAGVEVKTIFDHFVDAEFRTDWDKANIEHGDATTKEHLDRTDAQRRFDAFYAMCLRAASTEPGGKTPEIVTNLVIDDTTYERTLEALITGIRPPADPGDPGLPVLDHRRSPRRTDRSGRRLADRQAAAGRDRCRRRRDRPRSQRPVVHRSGPPGRPIGQHRVFLARLPRPGLAVPDRPPGPVHRTR